MNKMFSLLNVETGQMVIVPLGPGRNQSLFDSVEEARNADHQGSFRDKIKFQIRPVDIKIISSNIDPASKEEVEHHEKEKTEREAAEKEMSDLGITDPQARHNYMYEKAMQKTFVKAITDMVNNPDNAELSHKFRDWLEDTRLRLADEPNSSSGPVGDNVHNSKPPAESSVSGNVTKFPPQDDAEG